MTNLFLADGGITETGDVLSASSLGVSSASNASTNTKTSWVQLIASTSREYASFAFCYRDWYATNHLFDIGIGASGSEQVVVPNLFFGRAGNSVVRVELPLSLPRSTRISARHQCSEATAKQGDMVLQGFAGGAKTMAPAAGRWEVYGADTTNTRGVALDPGATANTKGAWTQITASTNCPHSELFIVFGYYPALPNGVIADSGFLMDVAVGASGSETVILSNHPVWLQSYGGFVNNTHFRIPVDLPSGTRIAARCQSATNNATYRTADVVVYGLS